MSSTTLKAAHASGEQVVKCATNPPPLVQESLARAARLEFALSCEIVVGELLAVLAANVRPNGRILELGTGSGVGLAWIVAGLSGRKDVNVVTVDIDDRLLADVQQSDWPDFVRFVHGDGAVEVSKSGKADLIFADAPGGKLANMEGTICALRANGLLVVDDMDLAQHSKDESLRDQIEELTVRLLSDQRLLCVECPMSSGVILAVRQPCDGPAP